MLIVFEWTQSQEAVRPYFSDILTDIDQPRLFAINTTLSVFLLGATSLCFLCALSNRTTPFRHLLFYFSQASLFAYLCFDDRFKVHELLGVRFNVDDHYVLLFLGGAELLCLWFLGEDFIQKPLVFLSLLVASALFAVMILFDGFMPHDMVLRLSIEDLAKVWSGLAFLVFGWAVLKAQVDGESANANCPDTR